MALLHKLFLPGMSYTKKKQNKTWSKKICVINTSQLSQISLFSVHLFRTALQHGGQRLNPGLSSAIRELWPPLCSTYERWGHSPPSDLLCVSWRSGRAQTRPVPQWAWSQTQECFSQMLTLTPENLPFLQSSLISCPAPGSQLLGRLPLEIFLPKLTNILGYLLWKVSNPLNLK